MRRIVSSILLLLSIIPASLFGQIESSEESKTEVALDDVFCRNKDFKFRLEYENDDLIIESFFLTEEEIYLCTSTLPFELMIVNAAHDQIMPFEIIWLKDVIVDGMGGGLSEIGGDILEIDEDDYFDDNVIRIDITVKFKLSQMEPYQELELAIYRNKVKFTQINGMSNYAHDDNEIEAYIGQYGGDLSELNTPWNFLLIGPQDAQGNPIPPEFLEGEIDKEKWINFVPKITADDNLLIINPDQIAPNREANISFDHDPLTDDKIIEVHSCDKEPELLLYAGGLRTIDIQVFNVCESDDDIRLIPHLSTAPNADPMAVCISPGADGTLDLERDLLFYLDQGDVYDGMTHTIRAGPGGVCDARMFREPANPGGPAGPAGPPTISNCTPVGNFIQNQLSDLNTLSSQVGLRYQAVLSGMIGVNFDVRDENGVISDGQERGFLSFGIEHLVGNVPANTIFTYLINDLGTRPNPNPDPANPATNVITILGEATNLGSSMLSLDIVDADYTTWFHEMGHAFGGLRHPDERNPDGTQTENFLAEDKVNFMYSTGTGRTNNVRRYQFMDIRMGQ